MYNPDFNIKSKKDNILWGTRNTDPIYLHYILFKVATDTKLV